MSEFHILIHVIEISCIIMLFLHCKDLEKGNTDCFETLRDVDDNVPEIIKLTVKETLKVTKGYPVSLEKEKHGRILD